MYTHSETMPKAAEVTVCATGVHFADDDQCYDGNLGCSHFCMQTLFGAACVCPPGMELNGSRICVGQ